jgi:hypothetical protein
MTRQDSLLDKDWDASVVRLGGTSALDASARETKAFVRARAIPDAIALLRLVFVYCLGDHGLRLTVSVRPPRSFNLASRFSMASDHRSG